jgi:hypothetical protein
MRATNKQIKTKKEKRRGRDKGRKMEYCKQSNKERDR